ncbi:MAG: DUF2905 domain-containing protein [Chloroflexi bacterium]|nr:MAG: DUF2905 domain-containing protein [Chloroflexota bacterium]
MVELGKMLLFIGLAIAFIGLVLVLAGRFMPWLGNLPGDFRYETENVRVYFPLATMLLISIVGSILLNLIIRLLNR